MLLLLLFAVAVFAVVVVDVVVAVLLTLLLDHKHLTTASIYDCPFPQDMIRRLKRPKQSNMIGFLIGCRRDMELNQFSAVPISNGSEDMLTPTGFIGVMSCMLSVADGSPIPRLRLYVQESQ